MPAGLPDQRASNARVRRHAKADAMPKPSHLKPPQSLLIANRLRPTSHPHATLMRPSCDPHATLMRPQSHPQSHANRQSADKATLRCIDAGPLPSGA